MLATAPRTATKHVFCYPVVRPVPRPPAAGLREPATW